MTTDVNTEDSSENENHSWSIIGGSVIGPPYKKRGEIPNQDDFGYRHLYDQNNQPHALMAVADGAGSLELSHLGAELAVQTALWSGTDCLHNTHENIENIAHIIGASTRKALMDHPESKELGSTLAVAIANDTHYAVTITGDAFAVIAHDDDSYTLLQNPKTGEYANITKLLTSTKVDTTVYTGSLDGVIGLALSSDGLAHSTLNNRTEEPTAGFWRTIFTRASENNLNIQDIFEYMRSLERIEDDTTMIVATKKLINHYPS